jgi:peptidoglycan/LPS O-acetylase OafA/YrhL
MSSFRTDIQALRGVAVSLVLLDHFKLGPFTQGFLGVDIFFVISGFLITGLISREINEGRFSIAEFYLRRAKRLLPAAYATILLTSIGSIWLLNSIEMAALTRQTIGALTYTINLVLWREVDYFGVAAGFKPLLHMWSLAIEEQFYLLFPILLIALPRRSWLKGVAVLGIASFGICIALSWKFPTATFYLLPTRAWELLMGAWGALLVARGARLRGLSWALVPALATIALLAVKSTGLPHPGVDALLVCAATLVVILANHSGLSRFPLTRALAPIGNISYSLYLVHWPIVVFMNSTWAEPPDHYARLGGLLVAVAIACLMYFAVEQPFRRMNAPIRRYAMGSLAVALALVGIQAGAQAYSSAGTDVAYLRRPNYGLDRLCDSYVFEGRAECKTAPQPETLIWGDSYAMFFASGAAAHLPGGMVQATYSGCPPFIGYAPYIPAQDNAQLVTKKCLAFNDSVRAFALGASSVKTVIFAASFWQYSVPGFQMIRRQGNGDLAVEASSLAASQQKFQQLVTDLMAAGKSVIVVTPPPGAAEGQVICSERVIAGKYMVIDGRFMAGSPTHCSSSSPTYRAHSASIDSLVGAAVEAGAKNIRLSDAICDEQLCHSVVEGVALYRDPGHLSYAGAKKVLDRLSDGGRLPPPFVGAVVRSAQP